MTASLVNVPSLRVSAPSRRGSLRVRAAAKSVDTFSIFSPSKINVFLRVVGRRQDGFHDLASLFHVIDLGDNMELTPLPSAAEADVLTCNVPGVPTDDTNLVIRALKLYREKTGVKTKYSVHLDKKVPFGGGLGGGSANGSTALWAINKLAGSKVSDKDLMAWSATIGSDCPVFFSRGPAYVTGRGEFVENYDVPPFLDTPMLLLKPGEGLATPEIFKALGLEKGQSYAGGHATSDPRALLKQLYEDGPSQAVCVNDLEGPSFSRLPALGELKDRLIREAVPGVKAVFMTGSGSTMVQLGSEEVPGFIKTDPAYKGLFLSPARFITRREGEWYSPASEQDLYCRELPEADECRISEV